ncbi:MAG: hypothetical protein KBF76_10565 [Verrucomicrobiales bacterium]|nr:hypothetical protein [Verrucomicrobiales bacterium]
MPQPASLPFLARRHDLSIQLMSTGKCLPERIVYADEVDRLAGRAEGWTLRHTGVAERRYVTTESSAFLGAGALREALAGTDGTRPDLLISAGGTPQQVIPCTASLIAREVGWHGVPCFDVNATCLGFIAALEVAAGLLVTGTYHRIAIVCAEIASKGLNWSQPEAAALMGDGAAAVILARSEENSPDASSLLVSALETWPEGAALTEIRGGGTSLPAICHQPGINSEDFLFHMDGPGIFRLAAEKIEDFVDRLIGTSADRWEGIDLVIPHQGSLLAMRHLRQRIGAPAEKMIEIAQNHGNIIAAAMPLALHEAVVQGRLQRGQHALFLGTSAGFSLGGALIRY